MRMLPLSLPALQHEGLASHGLPCHRRTTYNCTFERGVGEEGSISGHGHLSRRYTCAYIFRMDIFMMSKCH